MTDIPNRLGLRRWINAGGTLTRFGGAIASAEVATAMAEATRLSFDSWELQAAASRAIAAATGAQAGIVTTGASAALTLAAAAVVADASGGASLHRSPDHGGPVPTILMPRTHRNGYDRAFATAGARVVDVGDNDRGTGAGVRGLEVADVEAMIDPNTVAIACSASESCAADLPVLVEAGRLLGLPVIVDAAAQLPPADNLRRFVEAGAALVCFSGGKAIGGPQASGILAGRRDLVALAALQMLDLDVLPARFRPPAVFFPDSDEPDSDDYRRVATLRARLPRQGVGRGFKASKEAVVGLLVALDAFLSGDRVARAGSLSERVRAIAARLAMPAGVRLELLAPADPERAARLAMRFDGTERALAATLFAQRLADGEPPVALAEGGLMQGELVLDLACVDPADDTQLFASLAMALAPLR